MATKRRGMQDALRIFNNSVPSVEDNEPKKTDAVTEAVDAVSVEPEPEAEKVAVDVPLANVTEKVMPVADNVKEAVPVATKADDKMLGYTFKVSWALRKRMNRVVDEIFEREGQKINKKDFITMAVESLVESYEKKYNIK